MKKSYDPKTMIWTYSYKNGNMKVSKHALDTLKKLHGGIKEAEKTIKLAATYNPIITTANPETSVLPIKKSR